MDARPGHYVTFTFHGDTAVEPVQMSLIAFIHEHSFLCLYMNTVTYRLLANRHYTISRIYRIAHSTRTPAPQRRHDSNLSHLHSTLHTMSSATPSGKKTYHRRATGAALRTAEAHAAPHSLKLFGSCFCPFVQRVWISLEFKKLPYQYYEVDPYAKPKDLLEVNPRGLVPALRHGDWSCHESSVLMEYLEEVAEGGPHLLPRDPKVRASSRLWTDHVNRHVLPAFYRYLQCTDVEKQPQMARELNEQITKLTEAADKDGPFFLGSEMSFVDVQLAPWMLRMRRVLGTYRGWPEPEKGSRWGKWIDAVEKAECVKATTSDDELYVDSYERYAENRPNTSQVQKAINEGGGLP